MKIKIVKNIAVHLINLNAQLTFVFYKMFYSVIRQSPWQSNSPSEANRAFKYEL